MKNLILFLISSILAFNSAYSQTENYNLKARKLHKKVRKTIEHYYSYDKASGGFVKKSVNINRYNDDGYLIETYSLYSSKYTEDKPVKKLYNYNNKGILIGTKDISDLRGKYSTELKLIYNNKGHLTKRESVYKDDSKTYALYQNDRKGRVLNKKEYNKENKLIADVNFEYKGSKKIQNRTSFSAKDGSIIGNYVTTFDDDKRVLYTSESKYGTSKTTYEYDKHNNIIASYYTGKTDSKNTYNYVYDKRDNWIKKHYRSGKYQYFYFREIYFDNGEVTGSTDFDKRFINRHGNFDNVEVVKLKKKELPKKKTDYSRTNSSYVKNKLWDFDYVFVSGKVKKLKGTVSLKTTDNQSLKMDSNADIKVNFAGKEFNFNLNVSKYSSLSDKYEYKLRSDNGTSGILWIYKKTKALQNNGVKFNVNGLFTMVENADSSMSFYLK